MIALTDTEPYTNKFGFLADFFTFMTCQCQSDELDRRSRVVSLLVECGIVM